MNFSIIPLSPFCFHLCYKFLLVKMGHIRTCISLIKS